MFLALVATLAAAAAPLLAPATAPPGFARVQGREILGGDGRPILLRGMNLGNWLVPEGYMFRFEKGPQSPRQIEELLRDLVGPQEARAFWKEYRNTWITRDDIQYLRRIGLNSIRVPFHYSVLTPEEQPGVWLEDGFALLDRVIAWSREAGLLVVLDMHCAPGGQTGANIDDSHGYPWLFEEESAQARTIEVWKKLAERYRDEPAVLGYDLLNEPIPHWEGLDRYNPALEPLYKRIVAAVREADPNHVIFLGGARWDTNFDVFGPPFAGNLVYTFHKYWNETTDASLRPYLEFRDRHQVPIWLGESGENTDEWIAACVKLLEGHGIGWAFWPYKKMDSPRSIVSVNRPAYWDEIVAYAARRTYDFEANYKIRPPLEHARAALEGLLENARFENAALNAGYVRALGMRPEPQASALVLDGVTVVDVESGRLQPGVSVIVEGDRIAEVGPRPALRIPPGARVVEATGKYLIPGLWDMHVHTAFGDWFPGARDIALPLFVANGVTGVRDMGGDLDVLLEWRQAIARGAIVGPRMVISGPMLDGPQPRFPSSLAIATPEDGRRAVRELAARGVDFIKLQSLIPRDAVLAIADEARKLEIPFAGHVPDALRASEMSAAGQKSFEHLIGIFEGSSPREDEFLKGAKSPGRFLESFDPERAAALAALLARNRTWQCPTLAWEFGGNLIEERDLEHDPLAKYAPASWKNGAWKRFREQLTGEFNVDDLATRKRFLAKELEVVAALHRAGVPFLTGTDTVAGVHIFPGFSLHDELGLLVSAGFTPLEALRSATLLPAQYLSMSDRLGRVEKGKLADLVLLDANPLDDIANTRRIGAVVANGRFFSREDLDALLRGVEARAADPSATGR